MPDSFSGSIYFFQAVLFRVYKKWWCVQCYCLYELFYKILFAVIATIKWNFIRKYHFEHYFILTDINCNITISMVYKIKIDFNFHLVNSLCVYVWMNKMACGIYIQCFLALTILKIVRYHVVKFLWMLRFIIHQKPIFFLRTRCVYSFYSFQLHTNTMFLSVIGAYILFKLWFINNLMQFYFMFGCTRNIT